jgi:hypothetical protein
MLTIWKENYLEGTSFLQQAAHRSFPNSSIASEVVNSRPHVSQKILFAIFITTLRMPYQVNIFPQLFAVVLLYACTICLYRDISIIDI